MISVIVPVYNSSKYLRDCIDSILNQCYENFELLLIDDGSSDNSLDICKEYKDKRIKVIKLHHKGVANARNVGVRNSKGEFICFIDSDDIIEKNYLSQMIQYFSEDISYVECDFDYFIQSPKKIKLNNESNIYDKKDILYRLYSNNGLRTSIIVNKLYRKSIFKNIIFENKCNEDEYIIHKIILNSNKIITIENKLYHYRIRKNSRQRYITKDRINIIDVFDERAKIIKDEHFQLLNYRAKLDEIIYLYCVFTKYKKVNESKKIYKLFIKNYNYNYKFNFKRKLKYRLFINYPNMFARISLIKKQYKYI